MAPISDASVAASSPVSAPAAVEAPVSAPSAPATPEPAAAAEPKPIEVWTDAERDNWLRTGKAPTVSPKPAESAPAKTDISEAEPEAQADGEAEPAPASEPDIKQDKAAYKPKTAARIQELLEDRNLFRSENERLRDELRQLREQSGVKPDSPTDGKPKAAVDGDAEPKLDDCDSLEDYLDKRDAWRDRQSEKKRKAEESDSKLKSKIKEGREAFEDFDEVFTEQVRAGKVPINAVMADFIFTSENFPKLAHHLGSNPKDAVRISEMTPLQAVRELTKLEVKLSDSGAVSPTTPARKITSAPPPPAEIAGSAVPIVDEVEHALKTGDIAAYMRAKNAREIAARKR